MQPRQFNYLEPKVKIGLFDCDILVARGDLMRNNVGSNDSTKIFVKILKV